MWCVAHEIFLSLSFYRVFASSTYASYVLHTGIHICVLIRTVERYRPSPGRRVKGDLVLSRPPAPPSPPAFLPTPPVSAPSFSFCLSLPLSPIGPSSGSSDWRAKSRRRKKGRRERDRIREKEREEARREGERRTGPPRSRRSPGRSFLPRHRSKRITREKKGNGSFVEDQRIYRGPFCS